MKVKIYESGKRSDGRRLVCGHRLQQAEFRWHKQSCGIVKTIGIRIVQRSSTPMTIRLASGDLNPLMGRHAERSRQTHNTKNRHLHQGAIPDKHQ